VSTAAAPRPGALAVMLARPGFSRRALIAGTGPVTERLRVREIDDDEGRRLVRIIRRGSGSVVTWRRAQMVLLSAQGMNVAEIAKVAFTSEDRVRDVIRNVNADGFGSLYPRYKGGRPPKFTVAQRREIKKVARSKPAGHDLPFSTWSLAKLAEFLVAEGVVEDISHQGLRTLLRQQGVTFQRLKTWKAWARTSCTGTSTRARPGLASWSSAGTRAPCTRHPPGSRSSATTSAPRARLERATYCLGGIPVTRPGIALRGLTCRSGRATMARCGLASPGACGRCPPRLAPRDLVSNANVRTIETPLLHQRHPPAEASLLSLLASRGVIVLSALSIRNLDDRVKERLRVRAARHGRSMEAEVRAILTDAVAEPGEAPGLFQAIMDRFSEQGGVELDLPPRATRPRAAEFGS